MLQTARDHSTPTASYNKRNKKEAKMAVFVFRQYVLGLSSQSTAADYLFNKHKTVMKHL